MPKTLIAILTGLTAVISGWTPTTNLVNDIGDGILLLAGAHAALPSNPLINAVGKYLGALPQEIAAVSTGGVGIVGSQPASFDGVSDVIDFYAVRRYENSTPPTDSFAALFKAKAGT